MVLLGSNLLKIGSYPIDTGFGLRELHLEGAIDSNAMVPYLRKFPNLRKFSYRDAGAFVAGDCVILPPKIGPALSHLQGCLEELSIEGDLEENPLFGSFRYAPLGSLA